MYPIASTLRTQLKWSQYKLLISIDDAYKREYYELESSKACWTSRQLERQIHSQLYERLLLSNDKEAVLAVARGERKVENPCEVIKQHCREARPPCRQQDHSHQQVSVVYTERGKVRKRDTVGKKCV